MIALIHTLVNHRGGLCLQMGAQEENIDLDTDEKIPFRSSQAARKLHPFDLEASHVGSHTGVSDFWIVKHARLRYLRSIYVVIFKAKINVLLPFGPVAILLHYLTGKHVRTGPPYHKFAIF